MTKKYLILIVAIIINLNLKSQYDNRSRAEYIYDILRYVKWQNEEHIDTFRIGLLDQETSLYKEMVKVGKEKGLVHNKPIKIFIFDSIQHIIKTEIIFVNKQKGYDIDLVLRKTTETNTLIISENYEFHKSMINFIVVDGKKLFEINEKRIEKEGLQVTPLFLALGIKSETDWQELYLKTETLLDEEKQVVEKQTIEIKEQKEEIKNLQTEINAKKQELNRLSEEISTQQKNLEEKNKILEIQKKNIEKQKNEILKSEKLIEQQNQKIEEKVKILEIKESEIALKDEEIKQKSDRINKQIEQIKTQNLIIILFICLLILITSLGIVIFRSYKLIKSKNAELKKKNIEIMEQNEEILQQKEEIEAQRDEIMAQRDQIAKQNEQITDSIHYAQRIQSAVLTPIENITEILPEYYIFNRPRDIVSGDFYWIHQKNGKTIVAAADCTGHGVPGAFMSMLGITFLNDIMNEIDELSSNEILNRLRKKVMSALHQSGKEGEAQDGMDIALFIFDKKNMKIQYSGAFNPIYIIRKNELIEIKADRMPIGISIKAKFDFQAHYVDIHKNDMIYIFSDGYADQFGGEEGRKFNYKQFKSFLTEIAEFNMDEQKEKLEITHDNWKGTSYEQIDDILIIGVRI